MVNEQLAAASKQALEADQANFRLEGIVSLYRHPGQGLARFRQGIELARRRLFSY